MIHLFIKQHNISGVKYFGKTSAKDPYVYKGSGKYWIRHLNTHGRDQVTTLQVWSFEKSEDATEFALNFSREHDIVNSPEWANLMEENALTGCPTGYKWSDERRNDRRTLLENQDLRNKISLGVGRSMTRERRLQISESKRGIPLSVDHINKIKESNSNRTSDEKRSTAIKKSKALRGRMLSDKELQNRLLAAQQISRREKISKALKGKPHSPEFVEKRRQAILETIKRKKTQQFKRDDV